MFGKKDISKVSEKELSDLSIKYVIVPEDPDGEIFLKDRKYNEKSYLRTIERVGKIGLSEIVGFGKIRIYQTQTNKNHFWCECNAQIEYKFINPSEYELSIKNAKKDDVLVFSEGFDKNWTVNSSKFKVQSSKSGRINSFILPQNGGYELKVNYKPQLWVNVGLIISGLTLFGLICGYLVIYYRHGRTSRTGS